MTEETQKLIEKVLFEDKRPWLDLFKAKRDLRRRRAGRPLRPARPGGRRGLGRLRRHRPPGHPVARHLPGGRAQARGHQPHHARALHPHPPAVHGGAAAAAQSDGRHRRRPHRRATARATATTCGQKDGCKGCHMMMDPIGFGLETLRPHRPAAHVAPADAGKAGCELRGQGRVADRQRRSRRRSRAWRGSAISWSARARSRPAWPPSWPASCWAASRAAKRCALFARVAARFAADGHRFDQLLLDIVSLPGFGYRVAE